MLWERISTYFPSFFLGHVTQCHQIIRDLNVNIKSRFQIRFIETRKSAPRIAGFELRREHKMKLAYSRNGLRRLNFRNIAGAIEAGHVIVHDTAVLNVQNSAISGVDGLGEAQRDSLNFLNVQNLGCVLWWKTIYGDGRAIYFELVGVEKDLRDFGGDLKGDLDSSLEGKSTTEFEIGKGELIMTWLHPADRSALTNVICYPSNSHTYPVEPLDQQRPLCWNICESTQNSVFLLLLQYRCMPSPEHFSNDPAKGKAYSLPGLYDVDASGKKRVF